MKKNRKHLLSRISATILAMVLLCSFAMPCFAESTAAESTSNKKTVVVGWTLADGYEEMDEDGKASGYYYDYLQTLSYYNGWNCEFKVGSWNDCMKWLEDGTVDVLPNVTKINERLRYMDFSDSESFMQTCGLYVLSSNKQYAYGDTASFDGMRIAGIAGSYAVNEIEKYASNNGFSYELVLCDDANE